MDLPLVLDTLSNINGCTFASLDAETYPVPGIRKSVLSERVLLFTNQKTSGYENMVRRRLVSVGKNPDNFALSDLPWGNRIPGTPLIEHRGKYYLQTVLIAPGLVKYTSSATGREIDPRAYGIKHKRASQGLPVGEDVIVLTYKLESILRLRVLGETLS